MAEMNGVNTNAEQTNEERKKSLYEMLLSIIKAIRHRPCYEALERIERNLDLISDNSEATAVVLDNLIHTTSELASKLNSISIEDVEEEIGKIDNELNALSNSLNNQSKETICAKFEDAVTSYGINIDDAVLYKSGADGEMYLKADDNYYMISSQSIGKMVQFGFVPVDEDTSISRLKLNEVELGNYPKAEGIRLEILREHFPDYDDLSQYDNETKEKIQSLMESKKQKEALANSFNELYNISSDANGIIGVMREDKTYCVIHERKNAMVEFKMNNNRIVASLYTNYDNSDPHNPKGIGAKKTVGVWRNGIDNKVYGELDFDRDYIVRDVIKSDMANRFLSVCGLSNDDVKTMLKEEGSRGFKKANDEFIKKIDAIKRVMESNAPTGWDFKLIHDESTYICALSPNGNKTYINFDENGKVNQYAYKYEKENDVSLVADKGLVVVRNNRADQEDYKIGVALYEESSKLVEKAIEERTNKKAIENKDADKPKKERENGRD